MDRRAFLQRLGFGTLSAAAASVTFDIEKMLWVPRTIITVPDISKPFVVAAYRFTLLNDGTWESLANYSHGLADQVYRDAIEAHELMVRS